MNRPSVSGAASPPLKDESALSVMLRLASSNALTRKQTVELLLQHPVSYGQLDLPRIDIGRADIWGRGIGWQWRPPEFHLMAALPGLKSVIWSFQTRWCPVCMGFGFHSVWFQLSALAACPIHGCPLIQQCEACRVALPYSVSKDLFRKPYHCPYCSTPFADRQRSLRERLDFFRRTEQVERVFAPLTQWYGRAKRDLVFLDMSNRQFRNNIASEIKARVLDGAIRELAPCPRAYVLSDRAPLHIRSWTMRLAHSALTDELPSKYGLLSGGTARSVYQATVRSLARLVLREASGRRMCGALRFDNGGVASLSGWGPERLALVITRCIFEEPFFLACEAPIRGAVLRSSIFAPAIVRNCLLRVACRALVLSTFFAACELAGDYVARGFVLRRDLCASPGDLSVLMGNVSEGVLDGVVVFPETRLTDAVACGTADASSLSASVKRLNASFSESMPP